MKEEEKARVKAVVEEFRREVGEDCIGDIGEPWEMFDADGEQEVGYTVTAIPEDDKIISLDAVMLLKNKLGAQRAWIKCFRKMPSIIRFEVYYKQTTNDKEK